jgi:hypothetical protein
MAYLHARNLFNTGNAGPSTSPPIAHTKPKNRPDITPGGDTFCIMVRRFPSKIKKKVNAAPIFLPIFDDTTLSAPS